MGELKMLCKDKISRPSSGRKTWWEFMKDVSVVDDESALVYAEKIIKEFNKTEVYRNGKEARERVVLDAVYVSDARDHEWEKASLVTESGGYDRYRCKNCKVTGKRHGLMPYVTVDAKFEAKKYKLCT